MYEGNLLIRERTHERLVEMASDDVDGPGSRVRVQGCQTQPALPCALRDTHGLHV